jgi:hypothetical protein
MEEEFATPRRSPARESLINPETRIHKRSGRRSQFEQRPVELKAGADNRIELPGE